MPRIAKTQFILQQIGPFVVDGRWKYKYKKALEDKDPYFEINNERKDGEESTLVPTALVLLCSEVVNEVSKEKYEKYKKQQEEARDKVTKAMVENDPNEDGVYPQIVE